MPPGKAERRTLDRIALAWRFQRFWPPMSTAHVNKVVRLRHILEELAWNEQMPDLVHLLRHDDLHEITEASGIPARIVPHQLRHTDATFMLRAGVSFPGMMKFLGHSSPDMTMRYLGAALPDVQREYQQARSQPRHLIPQPKPANSAQVGLPSPVEALHAAQHVLEMFRRTQPEDASRRHPGRLANRLTRMGLPSPCLRTTQKMGRD